MLITYRVSTWVNSPRNKSPALTNAVACFPPEHSTEVEVLFEPAGEETRVSIEHRAWDTIPQRHVARHGFPERITLERVADWWRASLWALRDQLASR